MGTFGLGDVVIVLWCSVYRLMVLACYLMWCLFSCDLSLVGLLFVFCFIVVRILLMCCWFEFGLFGYLVGWFAFYLWVVVVCGELFRL